MNTKKYKSDYCFLMVSRLGFLAMAAFAVVVLTFCAQSVYIPVAENVAPSANLQDLQKGRQIYTTKCNSCHSLVRPERFTPEKWVPWVEKMSKKAKLTPEESKLVLSYLTKGVK